MFRWRNVMGFCLLLLLLGAGFWTGMRVALQRGVVRQAPLEYPPPEVKAVLGDEQTHAAHGSRGGAGGSLTRPDRGVGHTPSAGGEEGETDPDAVPDEYLLHFEDAEGFERFKADAKRLRLDIIGELPRWRALNLSTPSLAVLKRLLGDRYGPIAIERNLFVRTPDRSVTFAGGVPFSDGALEWLGVADKNATWGKGVTIAVLDTTVHAHSALDGVSITRFSVLDDHVVEHGDYAGHGTAVASLLVGSDGVVTGIAPAVDLLSIQVMTDDGLGDAFTLAAGIVEAVDRGADILNLSLGMQSDSRIVREAIEYALENGVAVVAAAGNDGAGYVRYPAQYEGVIAVSAVDAAGNHAVYANTGEAIDLAAPGVGVYTGWSDGEVVSLGGTSVATPFVAGALAGILSEEPERSTDEATELLLAYANDSGEPGADPVFGEGVMDVSRVLQRGEKGIVDAALSGFYVDPEPDESGTRIVWVSAQNRGTEPIVALLVRVEVDGAPVDKTFTDVDVGDVVSIPLEIRLDELGEEGILIRSVVAPVGQTDVNPQNDGMRTTIRMVTEGEGRP